MSEHIAPEGQIYACRACGRVNKDRMQLGDEACFLHAALVYENSIEWVGHNVYLVKKAKIVRKDAEWK